MRWNYRENITTFSLIIWCNIQNAPCEWAHHVSFLIHFRAYIFEMTTRPFFMRRFKGYECHIFHWMINWNEVQRSEKFPHCHSLFNRTMHRISANWKCNDYNLDWKLALNWIPSNLSYCKMLHIYLYICLECAQKMNTSFMFQWNALYWIHFRFPCFFYFHFVYVCLLRFE